MKSFRSALNLTLALAVVLLLAACSSGSGSNTSKGAIEQDFDEKRETLKAVEETTATTFTTQISSAAQQYMFKTGKPPQGFSDFVSAGNISSGSNHTLSLTSLGRQGGCTVSQSTINCATAFKHISVSYEWAPGGQVTAYVTDKTP